VLRARPGVQRVRVEGRRAIVEFTGAQDAVPVLLKILVDAAIPVVGFGERRATLEQIFMKVAAFETG
jgi:hypothetical protein